MASSITPYMPLNPSRREIRLLEIIIGDCTAAVENMQYRLHTVSLDDEPKFAALSYVWGDPDVTEEILVSGARLRVTANLAAALRSFRKHGVKRAAENCENELPVLGMGISDSAMEQSRSEWMIGQMNYYKEEQAREEKVERREKLVDLDMDGQSSRRSQQFDMQQRPYPFQQFQDFRLWIDAVCINQSDEEVKGLQIRLMAPIFANATQVIVWLGEEEANSELAMNTLESLSTLPAGLGDNNSISQSTDLSLQQENEIIFHASRLLGIGVSRDLDGETLGIKQFSTILLRDGVSTSERFRAIEFLFLRPWWRRVWTLQEVALARKALFVCGKAVLDSQAMHRAFMIVSMIKRHVRATSLNDQRSNGFLSIYDLFSVRTIQRQCIVNLLQADTDLSGHSMSFPFCSYRLRTRQCTDERDRVYGVLGLTTDSIVELNPPDYKLVSSQVFRRLARTWIQSKRNLDILSFCPDSSLDPVPLNISRRRSPSWVPHWNESTRYPLISQSFSTGNARFQAGGSEIRSDPFGTTETANPTLQGFVIDNVAVLGHIDAYSSFTRSKAVYLIRQWYEIAQSITFNKDDFWRTVFVHLTGDNISTSDMWRDALVSKVIRLFETFGPQDSWAKLAESPELRVDYIGDSLRFSVTSSGRMSMVPNESQLGDLICIFYGGQTPFVLRPHKPGCGSDYELVGECYVDGVMHGEILREQERGRFGQTIFTLH